MVKRDRDKERIADLEKQLAKIRAERRAQKNTKPVASADYQTGVIEVPENLPIEQAAPRQGEKFMGLDEDGNAVFYVGDATEEADPVTLTNVNSRRPKQRMPADKALSLPPIPTHTVKGDPGAPTISKQLADAGKGPAPAAPRLSPKPNTPTVSKELPRTKTGKRPSVKQEYEKYLAALRARNHRFAITGFASIVKNSPRSSYADNAQYWLAEAYYDQKKYATAVMEFKTVYERFPDGNKAPDAMLKAGYCYAALGDKSRARALLAQVAQVYPKAAAAALAAAKLASLEKP